VTGISSRAGAQIQITGSESFEKADQLLLFSLRQTWIYAKQTFAGRALFPNAREYFVTDCNPGLGTGEFLL
jgi:hypothetical protein